MAVVYSWKLKCPCTSSRKSSVTTSSASSGSSEMLDTDIVSDSTMLTRQLEEMRDMLAFNKDVSHLLRACKVLPTGVVYINIFILIFAFLFQLFCIFYFNQLSSLYLLSSLPPSLRPSLSLPSLSSSLACWQYE